MGLIDLKTNLKDLKFGHDTPGDGNSGQPYVTTKIPATDEPLPSGLLDTATGGPEFIIRGGLLLPRSIIKDEVRLAKWFVSTRGILFTLKQNVLSRTNVKTQGTGGLLSNFLNQGVYTPFSTLLAAASSPLGIYPNKQGLDPFDGATDKMKSFYAGALAAEISDASLSVDGILHNRLVGLYSVKLLGDSSLSPFFARNNITSQDSTDVIAYGGGPNSVLGIGKTHLKYATDNTGAPLRVNDAPNSYNNTLSYTEISDISKEVKDIASPISVDFRTKLRNYNFFSSTNISRGPSYDPGKGKTIEPRINLGDPGNMANKNIISYTKGYADDINKSYGAASPKSYDRLNALPIYRSTPRNKTTADPSLHTDLVDFRIGAINNNNPNEEIDYIHFRAFLNQISDNYDATWNSTKYIGRGENFYTYSGFERKISLSWTVAAQSKVELIPMYKKLNYLASLCAPDYGEVGYMRGNIIKLTIGGYLYEQPGFVTKISYQMNEENDTWEIAINDDGDEDTSVKQLPHIIRVTSFEFIPIHEFVPRKQINEYDETDGFVTLYGPERYISLQSNKDLSGIYSNAQVASTANAGAEGANSLNALEQDRLLFTKYDTGLDLPSSAPLSNGSVPLQSAEGIESFTTATNPFSYRP